MALQAVCIVPGTCLTWLHRRWVEADLRWSAPTPTARAPPSESAASGRRPDYAPAQSYGAYVTTLKVLEVEESVLETGKWGGKCCFIPSSL